MYTEDIEMSSTFSLLFNFRVFSVMSIHAIALSFKQTTIYSFIYIFQDFKKKNTTYYSSPITG